MENQMISDSSEKTPEQIELEMTATRDSITQKVAALEDQVMGTVQSATSAAESVKSFVDAVPDVVEQAAEAVKTHVRRTFDISSQVRENPWTAMCISVSVGCLAAFLIRGKEAGQELKSSPSPGFPPPPPRDSSSEKPGLVGEIAEVISRKLRVKASALMEAVVDAVADPINKNLREMLPKLVDEAARKLMPEPGGATNGTFDAASRIYG